MQPFQLLTHYLSACYGYYILGESVWDDCDFDQLCVRLLAEFDNFEHRHKHLVNKEILAMGTGFHLREEDYPPQVRHGFSTYVRALNSGQFEYDIRRRHEVGEEAWIKEQQAVNNINNQ